MDGRRYSVAGADGVKIGLLTEGSGQDLLLVHGGAGQIESWAPMWAALTARWAPRPAPRRSGAARTARPGAPTGDPRPGR